jgi:hypothetical protein
VSVLFFLRILVVYPVTIGGCLLWQYLSRFLFRKNKWR